MAKQQVTFLQAAKDFFGLKPGQASMDFLRELRELTDSDRAEIIEGLKVQGYDIIPLATGVKA
jgi:hypothetical protein